MRPCRKRKPTRRRTHRRASISRGIFARENSPSPRSAFQRAEERSTPTIEAQEASPASSLEKAASTSTSKRTPTSRARSSQAKRMRERTASARGTFSFSDLENGADYSAKSIGAEYHHYGSYDKMSRQEKNKIYNTIGLSPSLSTPAKGDANSTTTSAVAPGTIEIHENPTQDISALSRDTTNTLNELGRIFDKQKIEEQQELAKTFGEEAFRLAHNLPDDGSGRKIAVHAIIGGIMSQITGTGFASGAIGAGVNEAIIGEIKKIKDPGTAQIVSAIVGAAAAKAVSGNAGSGATSAASGTKWNAEYEELFRSMISPEEVPYFQEAYDRIDSLIDDISSEVMNEAKYLVDSGQLDIRNMPSDYTTIQMSIGEGIKAATVACIIDKFGNVYGTIAFAPGVAATAVPLNIGAGWLAISGKEETFDAYRTYISGCLDHLQHLLV